MDFQAHESLCGAMADETDLELIAILCTRAGMIMEDAAPEAIATFPIDPLVLDRRLAHLRRAAADIQSLITAAIALRGRDSSGPMSD